MPRSVLLPAQLAAADRTHVVSAMIQFRGQPAGQWLAVGHPAASGQFASSSWPIISRLPESQLIQAVAVAAPSHCIDGWSYLSRAIASLIAGDFHATRHLTYYAQLRAALSILANLGVGVFNRVNFSVTASGQITRIDTPDGSHRQLGIGTHDIVWDALKWWSSDARASRVFLDLIKVRGYSLRDCLEAVWPGSSGTAVASQLIKSWGLDLNRGKAEHVARNVSSYTPQALNPLGGALSDVLDFVESFWGYFEPSSAASFDNLDRFILRAVLQRQHKVVLGNNAPFRRGAISKRFDELPASVRLLAPLNFLIGEVEGAEPALLSQAKATTNPARPTEMLARAVLLLRAATAFTHTSFIDAGLDLPAGDMREWINEVAIGRGFWPPTDPPDDPTLLWQDVEEALLELSVSREPAPGSWFEWMRKAENGMPILSQAERVGVWSLGG